MRNKILIGTGLSACALAWGAKDPVIMTVNGVDVPKSEFEYLYHKNSQQQLARQPLEEYAEMFKIYKLKVADAKAEGLDTLASFRKEMRQYRNELAAPYLVDSTFLLSLVDEAAARALEDVEVSHIMLMKTRDMAENVRLRTRLDSIRNAALAGEDFNDLAVRFSQDRSVETNKGNLGFITQGRFPYDFESAAYNTPAGEISGIVESPAGYHIVKPGKRRAARGKVEVSHIMKMSPASSPEANQAKAKQEIDSIYAIVKNDPSRFAELARQLSDDKGSGSQGGKLPWFGPGEMVPEFEAASFALADGEISEPVRSSYGWHIILKHGSRKAASSEDIKPEVMRRLANPQDGRNRLVRENRTQRLAAKHKAAVNKENLATLQTRGAEEGVDSLFILECLDGKLASLPLASVDGKNVTVSDFMGNLKNARLEKGEVAREALGNAFENYYGSRLVEAEEDWLYANNPDYRNLLNEYHDGSLLYEVSVRKVWDKASKDTEGLEKYFDAHREDYTWTEPHVKGFLVRVANDSVAAVVKERMNQLPKDSLVAEIRKEFKKEVQIDKVLVTKGTNAMVDNIMFGGPEVTPSSSAFSSYFLYEPRVLKAPEDFTDVRGLVTGDYQNELEALWVEDLKKTYPVKVNEKELKKVK